MLHQKMEKHVEKTRETETDTGIMKRFVDVVSGSPHLGSFAVFPKAHNPEDGSQTWGRGGGEVLEGDLHPWVQGGPSLYSSKGCVSFVL